MHWGKLAIGQLPDQRHFAGCQTTLLTSRHSDAQGWEKEGRRTYFVSWRHLIAVSTFWYCAGSQEICRSWVWRVAWSLAESCSSQTSSSPPVSSSAPLTTGCAVVRADSLPSCSAAVVISTLLTDWDVVTNNIPAAAVAAWLSIDGDPSFCCSAAASELSSVESLTDWATTERQYEFIRQRKYPIGLSRHL